MKLIKQSNGGFRAEELGRRKFQATAAQVIDLQANAISELQAKVKSQGEFIADLSSSLDAHRQRWQLVEARTAALERSLWRRLRDRLR